ncbi:MAG: hypothetical protein ACREOI_06180 [bacterium]
MSYPANDLIDAVKALPVERQNEVKEFISLLGTSDEIIAVALDWITERLPDRYCAGEPRFDVQRFIWCVPVLLSYPSGKGGVVGEITVDGRTHEISSHTPLEELHDRGLELAHELFHAN